MAIQIRNSRIRLSQGLLFWREVGTGPTVVFLHGAWADGEEWSPVLEHLGQQFHCIVPDCLGFGESDQPRKFHYSIELEVELLAEFLNTLGLRSVYLVGHSLGGWIAATYALRYPDQVKALVLVNPEGIEVRNQRSRWRTERWLSSPVPVRVWLLQLLRPLLNAMGRRDQVNHRLRQRRTLKQSTAACQLLFRRRASEIQAELVGDRILSLDTPMLLMQSQSCDADLMAIARGYAQAPGATTHVIPDTDTDILLTHAAEVAYQVGDFVEAQEYSEVSSLR